MKALTALALAAALAAPAAAQEKPVRVAYYYKVKWGFQEEFERLFLKNHYPILAHQLKEGGRLQGVGLYRPKFHGEGRADWTFLVVISFANWAAVGAAVDEAEIAKRIFADFAAWQREERRRFEILEAHWDVPLAEIEPPR